MTLSAHKQSSTVDRCQNQLAKCPNSSWRPHSSQCHSHVRTKWQECPNSTSYSQVGRLSGAQQWACPILELVTSSPMHVPIPLRRSVGWQLVPTGKKQGGSSKQMVLTAARHVPETPFSKPASHEQRAHMLLSWPWETQESQVSSKHKSCNSQPHVG